jgi:hypothetical protein
MKTLVVGLILFMALATIAAAEGPIVGPERLLGWDAVTYPTLEGYRLYWRTNKSIPYKRKADGGKPAAEIGGTFLSVKDAGITKNGQYYWVVTSYDTAGNESELSNEVPFVLSVVPAPLNARVLP